VEILFDFADLMNSMKRFVIALVAMIAYCGTLSAQVSIYDVVPESNMKEFENDLKYQAVDAAYFSDAVYRAERRALRKERNTIDFTANLHGSQTAFSDTWQAAGDNTITILASANFLHTYKRERFSLSSTASAKFGYNRMLMELDGKQSNIWFKNVDEIALSTAPQWVMAEHWTYGATIKFRTQFAPGYAARGDKERENPRISNFMTPGYLDASVGFTYIVPSKSFPLKVNLAPVAMSATYRHDTETQKLDGGNPVDMNYGVANGKRAKYEGGLSAQLDFDRTWGKSGWLRYRTTAYSFYGWVTSLYSGDKIAPTLRWENTFDIKANKYFSTQIYFQLYYNKAEVDKLQFSSMLSVGLTYSFKNK
jgi:hypothetical protein